MKNINIDEIDLYLEKGFKLIDIRETGETSEGMIPNATNIPLSSIRSNPELINKEDKYILQCQSGGRSTAFTEELISKGYDKEKVINLNGGYLAYLVK